MKGTGELVNFKRSDEAKAIIKTLVDLTKFGYLEEGDLKNNRTEFQKRIIAIITITF